MRRAHWVGIGVTAAILAGGGVAWGWRHLTQVGKCNTLMAMVPSRLSPGEEASVRALGFDPIRVHTRLLEINHERARIHASEVAAAMARVKRLEAQEMASAKSYRDFMEPPVKQALANGSEAAIKHGEDLYALSLLQSWTPGITQEGVHQAMEEAMLVGRQPMGTWAAWERKNLEEYLQLRRAKR